MHKEISEEYRHTPEKVLDLLAYEQQIKANPENDKFNKSLATEFAWTYCCAAMCPENRISASSGNLRGRRPQKARGSPGYAQPRHLPRRQDLVER
eukprot:4733445-Heterocapsa_arctica.AAC.1